MTGVNPLRSLQQLHKYARYSLASHSKKQQLLPPNYSPSIHSLFLPPWLAWSLSCGLAYCPLCQNSRRGKKKGWRGWNSSRQDQAQCWSYLIVWSYLSDQQTLLADWISRITVRHTVIYPSIHPSICLWLWWQMVLLTWGSKPDLPH